MVSQLASLYSLSLRFSLIYYCIYSMLYIISSKPNPLCSPYYVNIGVVFTHSFIDSFDTY